MKKSSYDTPTPRNRNSKAPERFPPPPANSPSDNRPRPTEPWAGPGRFIGNFTDKGLWAGVGLILLLMASPPQAATDRALFQLNGLDYSASELAPGTQLALYELDNDHYRALRHLVDEVLFDIYLEEEAKRAGKSRDEIRGARLSVTAPDEKSVYAFYEILKDNIKQPYEAVRDQIEGHLHQQKINAKRSALLADYREKNGFRMLVPRPVPPFIEIRTQGFPVRGNPEAKVTIVEFADYRCAHCKTASRTIERVARRFEGKVKVVYMDFLVTGSLVSRQVAQGGVCAHQQGKFWAYHDLAYEHQDELNKASPVELAREIGLDRKSFEACLESDAAAAQVARAEEEARRLELKATPSVFVNGKRVVLHDIEQDIIEAIEQALK
uniref:Thioredoxin n=1 Tax=Candidatus Kentrum eta TaxID=2126337 RepID=A0A450U5K9_9GAMM|nr:MAG: Thioredoxin [Candidatus Kentron sp. H]VFJ88295.1 MAG: Thioredoxin [Candidatus Kentron sp. H]VFJ95510.1 MAG: Thioredoxin [Candidatus Kentron sp. H]